MVTRSAMAAGLAVLVAACGGGDARPARAARPARPARPAPAASPAGRPGPALGLATRLPAAYRRACSRQAAAAPRRARSCPPLIPAGRLQVLDAAALTPPHGEFNVDLASPSIGTLNGARIDADGGHWHYDVAWTPAARWVWVHRRIERPQNGPRSRCTRLELAAERVEACRVAPYDQGGGLQGGHIAYVWDHAGASYAISLHGYANEPRVQAMMAALIERVRGA
jgi:hypothetical protein